MGEEEEELEEHLEEGKAGPILRCIDHQIGEVFGKYTEIWYLDYKIWLGVLLFVVVWSKWILRGYDKSYHIKAVYTLALNIIILHFMQYFGNKGIVCAVLLAAAQNIPLTWLWWRRYDLVKSGGFTANSLYQDFSNPLLQSLILFLGQVSLCGCYLSALFDEFEESHSSYLFWLTSYSAMQMSAFFNRDGDSQLGSVWPTARWHDIIQHGSEVSWTVKDGKNPHSIRVTKIDLIVRGVMGFAVNCVFRDVFAFTIPVLLMQSKNPLEFVIFSVGVNYVVTIDDMSEKEFRVVKTEDPTPGAYIPLMGSTSSTLDGNAKDDVLHVHHPHRTGGERVEPIVTRHSLD